MIKIPYFPIFGSFLLAFLSCSPLLDYRQLLERDIQPPSFLGIHARNPEEIDILFSENITLDKNSMFIVPEHPKYAASVSGATLTLKFTDPLTAGKAYNVKATVKDTTGNTLTIIQTLYGFNPDLPVMVINEFTTQGSSANPDRIEIAVRSDGNTAGAVLYEGMDTDWSQRKIFPPIKVSTGDFIVVHFKSTGDTSEIDEQISKTESDGVKASGSAWDLWVHNGTGLSGNNGTLALFSAPYGTLIDGVLYSNRKSSSDEKYRGFGSTRVMERADRLAALEAWETKGEFIAPEDAVNPEDSTATRSLCRDTLSTDTNRKEDWHIVPTSGATFGQQNTDAVYIP